MDGTAVLSELQVAAVDVLIVSVETLVSATVGFVQTMELLSAHAPVLSISAYTEPALVVDCLRAGVRGFLWKGIDTTSMLQAIRTIVAGERPILPSMADRLVTYVLSVDPRPNDRYHELTDREEEVLNLITCGLSNKASFPHPSA
ncbi:MAG: response regulator transcription factor [Firmicutes bacterium]|nr:response regulator transcription factor [Bacillota bacterium]